MNIGRHHQQPTRNDISRGTVFADCTAEHRQRLDALATVVKVPAGRDLTVQGSRGREFGVILDESVMVDVNSIADLTEAIGRAPRRSRAVVDR